MASREKDWGPTVDVSQIRQREYAAERRAWTVGIRRLLVAGHEQAEAEMSETKVGKEGTRE